MRLAFNWQDFDLGNKLRRIIRRIPAWTIPLAIAIFMFFPVKFVTLTSDGSYYASAGIYVSKGLGILDIDKSYITGRPFLPILFGIAFKIFGPTPLTAFYTLRIFYLLMPLVVYGFGKKLFNRFTGLAASLFLLASYNLNNWAADIQIDYILPFFILLYLYVFVISLDGKDNRYYALSGILLAFALLIKETAIFFLPVPGLCFLFIKKYRTAKMFRHLLALYLTFAGIILIWGIYITAVTGNPLAFLGQSAPDAFNLLSSEKTVTSGGGILTQLGEVILKVGSSLTNYYANHLQANFIAAPLMLVSAIWIAVEAIFFKGKISSKILSFVFLCALPMIYFQGSVGFRSQQSIILFLFLWISLAYCIHRAVQFIYSLVIKRIELPVIVQNTSLLFSMTALIVCMAIFEGDGGLFKYIQKYNLIDFLANPGRVINVEYYDKQIVSDWMLEHIEPGAHIMGYVHNVRPNAFLTRGNFVFYNYPFTNSSNACNVDSDSAGKQNVLALDIDQFGNQFLQQLVLSNLIAITEENLLREIWDNDIQYFILSGQYSRLAAYFYESPYFTKIADFNNGGTQIFKTIQGPKRIGYENAVGKNVPQYLTVLKENDPAKFDALMAHYFNACLKWNQADVDTLIMNNKTTISAFNSRYTIKNYVSECKSRNGLNDCLRVSLEKTTDITENPWPGVLLGNLYYQNGEPEKAVEWYQKAWMSADGQDIKGKIDIGVNSNDLETYLMRFEDYPGNTSQIIQVNGRDYIEVVNLLDLFRQSALASPVDSKKIYPAIFIINRIPKNVLFEHPDSTVKFVLQIPKDALLEVAPALSQEVWMNEGIDGVDMSIELQDGQRNSLIYKGYQNPNQLAYQRKWITTQIDLSYWGGKKVEIHFKTHSNGNLLYDWAGWGEPRILAPVQYDFWSNFAQAEIIADYPDQLRLDQMSINYELRPVIFAHPHSRAAYNLTLPAEPILMFGIGLDPAVWDATKGDGVEFNVYVAYSQEPLKLYRVYHRYLDPKNNPADRDWVDERVDLSSFAGQDVQVIFETTSGPNKNNNYDWAAWSQPVLVNGPK